MAVEFILGTSGEDRAAFVYKRAVELSRDPAKKIYIIVPEQYTLETQKGIINEHPNHAILNTDVVSFNRLAYKVIEKEGAGDTPVIREGGKNMLVRKVLGKEGGRLKYFAAKTRKRGFVSEMKSMLCELEQYGCNDVMLTKAAESMKASGKRIFFNKLTDLALIYRSYKDELHERFITCEELTEMLNIKLTESDFLKDSCVFFDGFTGFTVSQYNVIKTIINKAQNTFFSLSYEGEKLHPALCGAQSGNLFFMTDNCIEKIRRISDKAGNKDISFTFTDLPKKESELRSPELEYLRHFFFINPADGNKTRKQFTGRTEAIEVIEADDIKEEINVIVGRIKHLIATEGYRYKEIAVVMEDPESYGDMTYKIMQRNDIPVFLDRTKNVSSNPFIESIRAFLKIVTDGFSYENIFRYIKTGFSPVPENLCDELDNYCLATGVRTQAGWKKEWVRIPGKIKVNEAGEHEAYYDLAKLNEARIQLYEHIISYKEKFTKQKKVSEKTDVLRSFLDTKYVSDRINVLLQTHLAQEIRQVLKKTAEIIDEAELLFGSEEMSLSEYADMLDAAFEEMSAGFIPPSNDCVIIGDTERTRLNNIRALFIAGVNDGVIPKTRSEHGILNDAERLRLATCDIELAPSIRELGFIGRFYLYLLLTKPFEKLYLSYCRKDIQGEAIRESYLIKELRDAYSDLNIKTAVDKDSYISSASVRESTQNGIISLQDIILSPESVSDLYNDVASGSISSFEGFAGCPFTYFMKKGLKVYPRERYEFSPADFGTVVHDILYRVLKGCIKNNILIHELSDDERYRLIDSQIDACTNDYYILFDNERNRFIRYRIREITAGTLKAVGLQLSGGHFKPHGFEKSFRQEFDITRGRLEFTGTIDRSDICVSGDNVYLRIVDYKTGNTDFDLDRFYYGRNMQLISYLSAAQAEIETLYPGRNIIPAAMCYMKAQNPFAKEEEQLLSREMIESVIADEYKMKGIVADDAAAIINNDSEATGSIIDSLKFKDGTVKEAKDLLPIERIKLLQKYNTKKICTIADDILSGTAKALPLRDSYSDVAPVICLYCDYRSVCNHSPELNDCRTIERLKSDELWARIEDFV